MKKSFIYAAKSALCVILLTGIFNACSNSTSSEEEQEPIGLNAKLNGQTVVNQLNNTVQGSIQITEGQTISLTVLFVDEDGVEFTPDPDEHSILVESNTSIISSSNISSDEVPFSFDLSASGNGQGNSIVITMNHEGAPEFVSRDLPVVVSASSASSVSK